MEVLLHINLQTAPSFLYESSLATWRKEALPKVMFLDLDSFSDGSTIQMTLRLIEDAAKVCLVVDVAQEAPLAQLLKIFEKTVRHKSKSCMLVNGTHPMILRMGKTLGSQFYHNLPAAAQQNIILEFLQPST